MAWSATASTALIISDGGYRSFIASVFDAEAFNPASTIGA